jgi:hypothetical protein
MFVVGHFYQFCCGDLVYLLRKDNLPGKITDPLKKKYMVNVLFSGTN